MDGLIQPVLEADLAESRVASFDPMSPVPPMMTSFTIDVPFRVDPIQCCRARTRYDRASH